MTGLPPAPALALAGMGFLLLYGVWQAKIAPRLARARHDAGVPL